MLGKTAYDYLLDIKKSEQVKTISVLLCVKNGALESSLIGEKECQCRVTTAVTTRICQCEKGTVSPTVALFEPHTCWNWSEATFGPSALSGSDYRRYIRNWPFNPSLSVILRSKSVSYLQYVLFISKLSGVITVPWWSQSCMRQISLMPCQLVFLEQGISIGRNTQLIYPRMECVWSCGVCFGWVQWNVFVWEWEKERSFG